jgi:acyl carrier protein
MEQHTFEEIQAWLTAQIANLTFVDPVEIDVRDTFNSFGLSSREAVMLSGDLEDWLGIRISPTIVYEYPSVESLARFLATEVTQFEDTASTQTDPLLGKSVQATIDANQMDDAISRLEQISDEEAEALLLKKLARLDKAESGPIQ